jgi:carbon monoxide dehydrogenase subunit G
MRRYELEPVGDDFVDSAPARFVNSVLVDASPASVWAALEDASAWPRWAKAIKAVEWTSAPPRGVGTTRTVAMVGRMTVFEEFIAWEPHRRMAFRFNAASMNGVAAFAERYELEPEASDRTRVTWVMAIRPKGVSRAIVPLTALPMRLTFGRWLRGFKKLVEAEYRQAPAREG